MSKFGFLKRTHIPAGQDGWRWMDLPEVTNECRLLLANATQENKQVLEAALRTGEDRKSERGGVTVSKVERGLESNREMLQEYLLKGWEGMFEVDDDTGKPKLDPTGERIPIPFTQENSWDFLTQCPGWLITVIVEWCKNPENFTAGAPPRLPHAGDLGNS